MALSGVGTYLPTIKEFIVHWNSLNVAAGEEVTLARGFNIGDLEGIRQDLGGAVHKVNEADLAREQAQQAKDDLLTAVRERVKQFRALLASQLPDSRYRKVAPTLPTFTAAGKLQLDALANLIKLWEALNEDTSLAPWRGPAKLAGGYTVTQAQTDITNLSSAYAIYNSALAEATALRAKRDEIMKGVAARLRQYRQAAMANLAAGHPLLDTLPTVAPTPAVAETGSLTLTGEWDDAHHGASLSWTMAEGEDHERFEVRYHPGPRYRDSEEQVVGSVVKGVQSVVTDYGLSAPGTTAIFRIYNVTSGGGEHGSNPIKIVRAA